MELFTYGLTLLLVFGFKMVTSVYSWGCRNIGWLKSFQITGVSREKKVYEEESKERINWEGREMEKEKEHKMMQRRKRSEMYESLVREKWRNKCVRER